MDNKITLPALASLLAARTGLTKRTCENFVRELFNLVSESLVAGESVKINLLGTFRSTYVEPRMSVDVSTGQAIEIPGHKKVVFTPDKELAENINSPFEAFEPVEIPDDISDEDLMGDVADEAILSEEEVPEVAAVSEEEVSEEVVDEAEVAEVEVSEMITHPDPESYSIEDDDIPEEETPAQETREEETPAQETQVEEIQEEEIRKETTQEEETIQEEETAQEEEMAQEEETPEEVISGSDISAEEEVEEEESIGLHRHETLYNDGPQLEPKKNYRFGWGVALGFVSCLAICAIAVAIYLSMQIKKITTYEQPADIPPIVLTNDSTDNVDGVDETEPMASEASSHEPKTDKGALNGDDAEEMRNVATKPSDAGESNQVVYDTISRIRFLGTMATEHYGNYNLWPYIYEENKRFLGHPDRIRVGTRVVIPPLSKYGVNPKDPKAIEKAKRMGAEIYNRYK